MTGVYDQAELYCAAFDFPVDAEVDWLLSEVGEIKTILEPMCGNARYGREFAERGVRYVGLDRSPAMLALAQPHPGVTLHEADATNFTIDHHPFDLAFCPIDSIRHLSADGAIESHLACIHRHLKPRGWYVIEADLMRHDGEAAHTPDEKSQWSIPCEDGSHIEACVYAERYDLDARREWERSIYRRLRDGQVVKEANQLHEMRMITWNDMEMFAKAGGFEITAIHAHLAGGRRPLVEPGPQLENTGNNHYVFMRRG